MPEAGSKTVYRSLEVEESVACLHPKLMEAQAPGRLYVTNYSNFLICERGLRASYILQLQELSE